MPKIKILMKSFYFLAFLFFGIFLMSNDAVACESNSNHDHSTTEISSTKIKKDCCDAGKAGHKHDEKHHCGKNKCKHSKCICSPSFSGVFLVVNQFALRSAFNDFYNENQKFGYPETSISSGFYSLFLKPKIG